MPRAQAQPSEIPQVKSVDDAEIARFSALSGQWWDENGPMKPLHRMNPVRIAYIQEKAILKGSTVLDIGTGAGLLAEPLCRLGATVTAIDASAENIAVATEHAKQSGLTIDYRATSAEALAAEGNQYDLVTALEIVEHVADLDAFFDAACALVKPGGTLILSTLNRTPKSYAFAIVGAEYLLRLLPIGTHQWKKFLRPSKLARLLRARQFNVTDTRGMSMQINGTWSLSSDLDINYLITAVKPL